MPESGSELPRSEMDKISWQRGRAPGGEEGLVHDDTERERIRSLQERLRRLKEEHETALCVLQSISGNNHASHNDRSAATLLRDEIRKEIELVEAEIGRLEELRQQGLVIPEDVYREGPKPGASERTGPFDFQRQRRK